MHGLINHSYQRFVIERFGWHIWQELCRIVNLREEGFEMMLCYDPAQTESMIETSTTLLHKDRDPLLEEFGHFIIQHPANRHVPRLLRMGVENYHEFLVNLIDLQDRIHIAIPKLELPQFRLQFLDDDRFELICNFTYPNYGAVFLGMLRAMAELCNEFAVITPISTLQTCETRFDIHVMQGNDV